MSLTQFDLDHSVGFLTYVAGRSLTLNLSRHLSKSNLDVTTEQYRVLHKIWEYQDPTQKMLVDALYQDKSTISRLVTQLVEKGYIIRNYSAGSFKSYALEITQSGIDCLSLCVVEASKTIEVAIAGLSAGEVDQFKDLLKKIINNSLNQAVSSSAKKENGL